MNSSENVCLEFPEPREITPFETMAGIAHLLKFIRGGIMGRATIGGIGLTDAEIDHLLVIGVAAIDRLSDLVRQ